MGTWTYSNDGRQPAGCTDAPGSQISVGSCGGLGAHIVVRNGGLGDSDVIGSIHVPTKVIPALVWNLISYGGADLDEVLNFIEQQAADSGAAIDPVARREATREVLRDAGYDVTAEGVAAMRERLRALDSRADQA